MNFISDVKINQSWQKVKRRQEGKQKTGAKYVKGRECVLSGIFCYTGGLGSKQNNIAMLLFRIVRVFIFAVPT